MCDAAASDAQRRRPAELEPLISSCRPWPPTSRFSDGFHFHHVDILLRERDGRAVGLRVRHGGGDEATINVG